MTIKGWVGFVNGKPNFWPRISGTKGNSIAINVYTTKRGAKMEYDDAVTESVHPVTLIIGEPKRLPGHPAGHRVRVKAQRKAAK